MHLQDTVHLRVIVRIDTKSTKACEEPSYCTWSTRRPDFSFLNVQGPTAMQLACSFYISANDVFTLPYNHKASYYQGLTRSGDEPKLSPTVRAVKPWETFCASR